MNFDAHMRVGSLEIMTALLAVAVVAARPRGGDAQEAGLLHPIRLRLRIREKGVERGFEGVCPLTIGRSAELEVPIHDEEVSRQHARLETHGRVAYVRDLQSRNGTFLNGHRVGRAIEIRPGDEIDIGTTRLIVEELNPWT